METLMPLCKRVLLITCCMVAIAGCQSAATLSLEVRSGGTVLVGLSGEAGQAFTNTTAEIIRTEDVSASITDSAGTTAAVRVRNVFRVYGDPTANDFAANKGQWLAVIDLIDSARQPLAFNEGPATLNIQSSKLVRALSVNTTILGGTGSLHPLTGAENGFNKLPWLAPAKQALVSVTGNPGQQRIGAVQYQFNVDRVPQESGKTTLSAIEGIKLQGRRDISFLSWSSPGGSGGTDLHVVMTAPDGVARNQLKELDMALVAGLINREANPANYFTGSLQSARFYDTDGELISGLNAQVGQVE